MADDTNSRLSPTIVAAMIALIGVLGAAAINNWDKLFPQTVSQSTTVVVKPNPPASDASASSGPAQSPATTHVDPAPPAPTSAPAALLLAAHAQSVRKWHDLVGQLKRRVDLVPGFFAAVQGAASGPGSTKEALVDLVNARAIVSNPALMPDEQQLTGKAQMISFAEAEMRLGSAVDRAAKLPAGSQDQNVQTLRSQIEGADDRIKIAIADYNRSAESYNARAAATSAAPLAAYPTS